MNWFAVWPLLRRYGPMLALVVGVGLAGWWAYRVTWQRGWDARDAALAVETAERQARLDDIAADLRAREIALERASQDRAALERELTDEAMQDPLGDSDGLSLDSLHRLNRIR